jgi:hypothetical protein
MPADGTARLPMPDWMREYHAEWLRLDIIASLTPAERQHDDGRDAS